MDAETRIAIAVGNRLQYITERRLKPTINIMDIEAPKAVTHVLTKRDTKHQLVDPHCHRFNAAERAINTFKNNFIAGLYSTDKNFSLELWDLLIKQAITTLHLLRNLRINRACLRTPNSTGFTISTSA